MEILVKNRRFSSSFIWKF